MNLNHLREFLELIEPFQHLWRSVEVTGYSAKVDNAWLLLGARVTLYEKLIEEQCLEKLADFDSFFAFRNTFSIDSFAIVMREIAETDNLHMNMGRNRGFRDVSLTLKAAQNGTNTLSSFPPRKFDNATGRSFYGINSTGFDYVTRNDWWIHRIVGLAFLETVNGLLRLNSDLNGLDELARQETPGLHLNSNQCPELQIVAPFPFQLDYDHSLGVRLTAPSTAKVSHLRIKVFFRSRPPEEKILNPVEDRLPDGTFATTWRFTWPEGVNNAEIRLFYCDRDINGLTVNRWAGSGTIRGAVNEYFDPDHALLKKALEWQTDKNWQDNFEWAIVRLLNILGIPAIWYGKLADSGRPDASALVATAHSPIILVIECTREKPDQKFAALAERVNHLKAFIKCNAEVLPVVFCATAISNADLESAFGHGVSILGKDDIAALFALISSPQVTLEFVVSYLRKQAAKGSLILSEISKSIP